MIVILSNQLLICNADGMLSQKRSGLAAQEIEFLSLIIQPSTPLGWSSVHELVVTLRRDKKANRARTAAASKVPATKASPEPCRLAMVEQSSPALPRARLPAWQPGHEQCYRAETEWPRRYASLLYRLNARVDHKQYRVASHSGAPDRPVRHAPDPAFAQTHPPS